MMRITSSLIARLKRVRTLRYRAATTDLGLALAKSTHAESSCEEALKATEAIAARDEPLPDLAALGQARIKRLQVAAELKCDLAKAAEFAAKAKAAHDQIGEIESADRAYARLLKERADELEAEEFFACKR
jgi:hypothetical protein